MRKSYLKVYQIKDPISGFLDLSIREHIFRNAKNHSD
jgi:hypothetical protein